MFEKYMEKDLIRKISIINLLWENQQLTSIELAAYLEVTTTTVKSDIKFINVYYCLEDTPLILSSSNGYCIAIKEKRNKVDYLKKSILFFVLIFNIMNSNYFDETEILENYQSYVNLISHSPTLLYKDLVLLFEKEFDMPLGGEKLFEATLISFLRKCILNLQILIPEEHFELGNIAEVPVDICLRIKNIFLEWNNLTKLDLKYSDNHIKYFTSKIYFLLSKIKRPQNLYLLTSFYTDYLLAKEILVREYGNIVCIQQFNPNKELFTYASNDLVLYDTEYEILKRLPCLKLKISYVFDLVELQIIRERLFGYDLKGIMCNRYAY